MNWKPVPHPIPIIIQGDSVRLEPLVPDRHAQSLFELSHGTGSDPDLWRYMFYGPFQDVGHFTSWLTDCARSEDPLFFVLVDNATGIPFGMASFMRITPQHGVIEIGNIWISARFQRTRQATEAIYLLARHAFETLGYRRLEWKCDANNARSRRAAERFGFKFEGLFCQHMIVKGRNRDTAWYAMLDGEWPVLREAFEKWLLPTNFDASGKQVKSLATIRAELLTDSI